MKIFLRWFNSNSLKANPGKFQFMVLGKFLRPKYCLTIESINVKELDHAELLGKIIEKSTSRIYIGMRIKNCMLLRV